MPTGDFPTTNSQINMVPLGVHAKCYRTVSTKYDKEVKNASNMSHMNESETTKITRKGDGTQELEIASTDSERVDFLIRNVRLTNDDSQEVMAFLAAKKNKTPMDLLFLDQAKDVPNAIGWSGDYNITKMNRKEDDKGDVHYECSAVPAPSAANQARLVFVDDEGVLTDYVAPVEEEEEE